MANVGGALKAILLFAEILNYLFNQWLIILDIQYELEKLGLEYSYFCKDNICRKRDIDHKIKNQKLESFSSKNENSNYHINKNTSQIPFNSIIFSGNHKNILGTKLKQINNYIDKKDDNSSKISSKNNINENNMGKNFDINNNKNPSQINNKIKKKKVNFISFFNFITSLFKEKIKGSNSNIKLMQKFWINTISEENIVVMDLKLYKLSHKYLKSGSSMHINNLIEDSEYKKRNSSDYESKKVLN